MDMRHVLLVLPFLLDGLLDPAVLEEHNRKYLLRPVHDPSTELVGITILFLQWYMLYCRRYTPKDTEDVKELATLGDRFSNFMYSFCLHTMYISLILYDLINRLLVADIWIHAK